MNENKNKSPEVGSIVFSLAGRDKGRFFIVTEVVDDTYIKIADGDVRRIDNPKLKKIKHVKPEGCLFDKIAVKLIEGKKVFDAELKSALKTFNG